MSKEDPKELEKLSVKELRRQAAIKNVPLTHISAAIEKPDLINLIMRAGPVLDAYDVTLGVKVHSAGSIAAGVRYKKKKKDKKKKRRRRSTSSSSSSSSRSRNKNQAENRRITNRQDKRKRSPSLEMITPLPVLGLRALPAPSAAVDLVDRAPPATTSSTDATTLVEKGVAAAAALGFNVLPKASADGPAAPAPGLRPSLRSGGGNPALYGSALLEGSRVCIQYMCSNKCDMGANCPESHVIDPEEEMRVRAKYKEKECNLGAGCSRPGCLYRHPGERTEESQYVPNGQQMSLRAGPQGLSYTQM